MAHTPANVRRVLLAQTVTIVSGTLLLLTFVTSVCLITTVVTHYYIE